MPLTLSSEVVNESNSTRLVNLLAMLPVSIVIYATRPEQLYVFGADPSTDIM